MDMIVSAYKQNMADKEISKGDVVFGKNPKLLDDNKYIININGKNVEVLSKDLLQGNNLKLVILKTNPLEVELFKASANQVKNLSVGDKVLAKIISQNSNTLVVEINGKTYQANISSFPSSAKFLAEIIKTEPLLMLKEINISPKISSLSTMAQSMLSFNQKEIMQVLKEYGAIHLSSFMSDDIKNNLKNSGQFFEYKILKGLSLKGDMKLSSLITQNDKVESSISKLQIANALIGSDFFSFFENEELDFNDGIMRFSKNNKGGYNVFLKLSFSKIGDTIISIIKHYESYYITVRTKVNISAELSRINIKNTKITWKELQDQDKEYFNIKKDDLKGMEGFNIIG